MNKANKLEELMDELLETFVAKNEDYGDSFTETFKEFGITSAVVRMNDKMNRIKSLSKKDRREVKDESLKDSLMDLANYALMTVIELENEQMRGPKGESGMSVNNYTFNIDDFKKSLNAKFTAIGKFEEFTYSDDEVDWIDERLCNLADDKKYYLRAMLSGIDEDENYLNFSEDSYGYCLMDEDDCWNFKTKFTKDEIRNLVQNWDVDLDDFEIEEVEDE